MLKNPFRDRYGQTKRKYFFDAKAYDDDDDYEEEEEGYFFPHTVFMEAQLAHESSSYFKPTGRGRSDS